MQPTKLSVPPIPLTTAARERLFGRFSFKSAPALDNPEKILVTDSWAKENLVKLSLPPIIARAEGADIAWFHRLVAPRFVELCEAWERAGLGPDILQWGGSYAARFMRGSKTLSAHAWGTAFDLNCRCNPLGRDTCLPPVRGNMVRLAAVAETHGWAWGGRFKSRNDPMHLELAKL